MEPHDLTASSRYVMIRQHEKGQDTAEYLLAVNQRLIGRTVVSNRCAWGRSKNGLLMEPLPQFSGSMTKGRWI